MELNPLLEELIKRNGSDLHIQPNDVPTARIFGELVPLPGQPLSQSDTLSAFESIATPKVRDELEAKGAVDFSYQMGDQGRFRVNAFREMGNLAIVFRYIPSDIPTFEDLNLPPIIRDLAMQDRGLILVVGVTGSGKSTTLAAMLDQINANVSKRIITIEDPVEYIHHSKKCFVSQRELGSDTTSFASALRSALRQDPDVILVGELRDLETIRTAVSAAETGHIVLSTLHTNDTVQTVDRIIGYYPAEERELARTQVAMNLKTVIAQRLVRSVDGGGRIPAVEILVNNSLVQKMVLQNKIRELYDVLKNRQDGMQSFDLCLYDMVKANKVSEEESMHYAVNPSALKRMLAGGMSDSDRGGILGF